MSEELIYCKNHAQRETTLRCNRCSEPICPSCAVLTPVGYRCKQCIQGQQAVFETARWWDFLITVIIAAFAVGLAIVLLNFLGFWGFFLAPIAGSGIEALIRTAVCRRRSRRLPLIMIAGGFLGLLPHLWPLLTVVYYVQAGVSLMDVSGLFINILFPVVYAVLMVSVMVAKYRGLRL